MKIFGWSADSSGCGWYRVQMPLDELARRGHETLVNEVLPNEWLDSCDVLVGQRICKPGPTGVWQRVAQHHKRPLLVFDIDDDLWNVDPSSTAAHAWFGRLDVQDSLRRNIQVADLITVTTEALADRVKKINPNVVVIPNAIPQALIDLPEPERTDDRVVVGWGGSSTHVMDFVEIGPRLAQFIQDHQNTLWHTIGGPQDLMAQHMPWLQQMPQERWRATDWCHNIWDYYRTIGQFDVATAPLAERVFNRSKSPIKALEAAARGVPIVASDVGPYSGYVRHGDTGLLVRQPHKWPKALRALVLDTQMRAEMGAAAREQAREHTIERRGELWEQALLSELTSSREAS